VRTVLVVEDETEIRELLRRYLEREGLSVLTASTGAEALRRVEEDRPDLVLLDLGLPDIDGTEVLATTAGTVPVLVLTARSRFDDRVAGLRMGADDYVVKPFSPTEVVLRAQAILARGPRAQRNEACSFGGGRLHIDEPRHHADLDGTDLTLTPGEWQLLLALAGHAGQVFTRRELIEHVNGYTFEGYERAIDSHVKNLRRKLGPDGHDVIETVVGFGYRLGLDRDA
jgi:DNA-binding response OmpR family regulator